MIDIGVEAIVRDYGYSGTVYTLVNKGNPANASGKITSVEIYVSESMTDVKIAIFYEGSANELTTRDYESIGAVTSGAKRTFNVNLDVEVGDYIGFVASNSSRIFTDISGGSGVWNIAGDSIPYEDTTFGLNSSYLMSLYGTGIFGLTIGGNFNFSGSLSRLTKKALTGVLTSSGSLIKKTILLLAGVFGFSGTINQCFKKTLSGVLTFTEASLTVMIYYFWGKITKAISTYSKISKDVSTYSKVNKDVSDWNKDGK